LDSTTDLVEKDSPLVQPEIVVRSEELYDELPDAMLQALDVVRDLVGVGDLAGPPSAHDSS